MPGMAVAAVANAWPDLLHPLDALIYNLLLLMPDIAAAAAPTNEHAPLFCRVQATALNAWLLWILMLSIAEARREEHTRQS